MSQSNQVDPEQFEENQEENPSEEVNENKQSTEKEQKIEKKPSITQQYSDYTSGDVNKNQQSSEVQKNNNEENPRQQDVKMQINPTELKNITEANNAQQQLKTSQKLQQKISQKQSEKSEQKSQQKSSQKSSQKQEEEEQKPIDPILELIRDHNPLYIISIIDQIQIEQKTEDGTPLLCLLANKFLPLDIIIESRQVKFETDADGRSPLHYAVSKDDIKSVYWCLRRGARNISDNFGNTPMMDAIRLGHRRSFLLCLHYQHIDENLPHICAKYNRLWELKVLEASGLNIINSKDDHAMVPLEIAIENYSYETVDYLASISKFSFSSMKKFTDSNAMVQRLREAKDKGSPSKKSWMSLGLVIFWILFFLLGFYKIDQFKHIRQWRILQLLIILGLNFSIILLNIVKKSQKKPLKDILTLLQQPHFPPLADICPSCLDFQDPSKQDHCPECKRCVQKFHFHDIACVNKSNQLPWFILQFFWLYFLWSLLQQFCASTLVRQMSINSDYFLFNFIRSLHLAYTYSKYDQLIFYTVTLFLCIQQFVFCAQLIGMMFMNRTYQQVIKTEQYPHLYYPYRTTKDKKIRLREKRIFYEHKLLGGLVVGIRNMLKYFFT